MQITTHKHYLYSYKADGHILNAHENEYMDDYDLHFEDELDDDDLDEPDDL